MADTPPGWRETYRWCHVTVPGGSARFESGRRRAMTDFARANFPPVEFGSVESFDELRSRHGLTVHHDDSGSHVWKQIDRRRVRSEDEVFLLTVYNPADETTPVGPGDGLGHAGQVRVAGPIEDAAPLYHDVIQSAAVVRGDVPLLTAGRGIEGPAVAAPGGGE